jgi:hypothetical protein
MGPHCLSVRGPRKLRDRTEAYFCPATVAIQAIHGAAVADLVDGANQALRGWAATHF